MAKSNPAPSETTHEALLNLLKTRFEKNRHRHPNLDWETVLVKLEANPTKLASLSQMEQSGGEPDVILFNESTQEMAFVDCAPETPAGRRSVCYDREGLESRKEHRPQNSAIDLANQMGVTLLTEAQYHYLQQLGPFDAKTSSWLQTPEPVRKLGGALFGDLRYGRVFVYHNGAQSYYAARAFRGLLAI